MADDEGSVVPLKRRRITVSLTALASVLRELTIISRGPVTGAIVVG
jgi:hypothetical protein